MKRKKRKSKARMWKAIFLQLIFFTFIILCSVNLYNIVISKGENRNRHSLSVTPSARTNSGTSDTNDIHLEDDQLSSSNAILIRLSDKKVLYQKDSNEIIYPASLTKIMTAIVAIENLNNLNDYIELPNDIFHELYEEDASMAGFEPGETVPALDLLYGILLPSGAECCVALSDYLVGSETAFVDQMNQKAQELGMKNTHFTNTTGLNDEDHYTTVADLALLLEYALQNNTFRDIFTASRYSTTSSNHHPDGFTFYSTLFKNMDSPDFDGGSILGGKTGYTSEAGLCLASLAEKQGIQYILITAGAKGDHDTKQYNIEDALFVYDSLK